MKAIASFLLATVLYCSCSAQTKNFSQNDMRLAANAFLQNLTPSQREKAEFSFADEERFRWNYVPIERNGLPIKELSETQYRSVMALLQTVLSDTGLQKTKAIIELETVLKDLEKRTADDHYRDPGKYYISVFGNPARDSLWGWRFEGHHVSFNFTSDEKGLVSGTPGFLGANPAVVQTGPQKGKEVLQEETRAGFALLHSLTEEQKRIAIISTKAPGEIITGASHNAMLEKAEGILYSELTAAQQPLLLHLLQVYLHRYKSPFAEKLMKELETAGTGNLRFAWAGAEQPGLGNPHYYRIQGPTILIEYDNTQNNANHVHTVVRDLKNDFGDDELSEHYRHYKHQKM